MHFSNGLMKFVPLNSNKNIDIFKGKKAMKKIELEISDELWTQLEALRSESGLTSMNDFLLAILQQFADQKGSGVSKEEDEEIRKRLEDLGYM